MIDLFKTNGSSPPVHQRCGTTLGTACWTGSLLAGIYHAPCATSVGHAGDCRCPKCGAVISTGINERATAPVATRNARELAALALYLAALAFVATTITDMLPVAAFTGAVYIRWGVRP
jgi:hypothetical protein